MKSVYILQLTYAKSCKNSIRFPHFSPLQLLLYRINFYSISERVKAEVFILPHHLDLTLSPFGSKMHCRDKEYYNGQQGKEYQDMKRTE